MQVKVIACGTVRLGQMKVNQSFIQQFSGERVCPSRGSREGEYAWKKLPLLSRRGAAGQERAGGRGGHPQVPDEEGWRREGPSPKRQGQTTGRPCRRGTRWPLECQPDRGGEPATSLAQPTDGTRTGRRIQGRMQVEAPKTEWGEINRRGESAQRLALAEPC